MEDQIIPLWFLLPRSTEVPNQNTSVKNSILDDITTKTHNSKLEQVASWQIFK